MKYTMHAFDYRGVYVFAPDGSGHIGTYCNACAKEAGHEDLDADHISPIFATDEADSYPSCETCGGVFEYINLTEDGRAWLEEAREERIAEVKERTMGGVIEFFVSELPELEWLFGGHYPTYNAATMASHGRLEEAIAMLEEA